MILHTLNRSPLESTVYRQALRALADGDSLLLIEDRVLGALPAQQALWSALPGRLLALAEDLEARGLSEHCAPGVEVVDVDGFVRLTEEADRVVSWY